MYDIKTSSMLFNRNTQLKQSLPTDSKSMDFCNFQ